MELSIVVPTINSASHIQNNITILENLIKKINIITSYEIIISAQTSIDSTFDIVKSLKSNTIKPLCIREKGKGIGISQGIRNASYNWILMIDDDLPYNIEKFIIDSQPFLNHSIIIASRYGNNYRRQLSKRTLFSWLYKTSIKVLFGIKENDIQAGMKIMRRNIFNSIIPYPEEIGYLWDTELLYLAKRNHVLVKELSAELIENKPNQLRILKDVPKMCLQLIKLRLRYWK